MAAAAQHPAPPAAAPSSTQQQHPAAAQEADPSSSPAPTAASQPGTHLGHAQRNLLGDVAVAVARELGLFDAVRVARLQAPLALALAPPLLPDLLALAPLLALLAALALARRALAAPAPALPPRRALVVGRHVHVGGGRGGGAAPVGARRHRHRVGARLQAVCGGWGAVGKGEQGVAAGRRRARAGTCRTASAARLAARRSNNAQLQAAHAPSPLHRPQPPAAPRPHPAAGTHLPRARGRRARRPAGPCAP